MNNEYVSCYYYNIIQYIEWYEKKVKNKLMKTGLTIRIQYYGTSMNRSRIEKKLEKLINTGTAA